MNNSEEFFNIDTPENVVFGYEVAGIGSRFLAAIIDSLLILTIQIIVNLTLVFLLSNLFSDTLDDENLIGWFVAFFGLISFFLFWGYYILFEVVWNGQSPGKRWIGLRVLCTDGTPITLTESIIRNLMRLIDFMPIFYGVGIVTMFINEQARRLGDLTAGTLVVHDRSGITLESLSAASVASGAIDKISVTILQLPLERLTDRDIEIVEDYLRRKKDIANASTLAERLVQTLYQRMELPPPQLNWLQTERTLRDIVIAYHHRASGPKEAETR